MLNFLMRTTRIMLYICFGAASKTLEDKLITALALDGITRKIFVALQFVALFFFCIDVVNLLLEDLLGESPLSAWGRSKDRRLAKGRRPRLSKTKLQKILNKAKLLWRNRGPYSSNNLDE